MPRIPSATLARDALVDRLNDGADAALTMLSAGPGSGKTALLAAWVSTMDTRPRWLSCDPDHADPDRFWTDLGRAIDESDFEMVDAPDAAGRVLALVDALGVGERPAVIVIDDFHNARPDAGDMMKLVGSLPPSVRLVISTRADPPLPLGRLRVQGRLLELRQTDLRFTPSETEALLDGLGLTLTPDELAMLDDLTEGWTAGVQLAGLSLQAHRRPVELLRTLSETNRSLVDFLMNEVIDLQPVDVRDFLLASAELETFDAPLCDDVLERSDSAAMLERIRVGNLFLVQIDPDDAWYRYHHLFGHFLRARLRSTDPERVGLLHGSAGRSSARRGDLVGAIRHHMLAGDMESAHTLLRHYTTTVMSVGDRAVSADVARLWLAEYGAAAVQTAPSKVIECAVILAATGRTSDVQPWLARLEDRAADMDPESAFMLDGIAAFVALRDGQPEVALARSQRALERARADDVVNDWVPTVANLIVQAHGMLDDLDAADRALDDARASFAGVPVMRELRVPGHASLVACQRGELVDAERLAAEAMAGADRLALPADNFGRADPELTRALLLVEQRDFEAADLALEGVLRIAEDGARPPVALLVHLELATIAGALGDVAGTQQRLALARGVFAQPSERALSMVDRVDARLAFDRGDIESALALLRRLPPGPITTLLDARGRLMTGQRSGVRDVLTPFEPGTRRQRIETSLLLARAAEDDAGAFAALNDALALAEPMGFVHTIVREGPELLALLDRQPARLASAEYVKRVQARAVLADVGPAADQSSLVDPLSERELTILRHLAGPQDSREIADSLYLSVNTVRTHVKAIYRKLGVGSRTDAVARARDLVLL